MPGTRSSGPSSWTMEQMDFLRANYSKMSNRELLARMPAGPRKLTRNSICGKAARMGLSNPNYRQPGVNNRPKESQPKLRRKPSFGSINRTVSRPTDPMLVERLDQAIDLPNLWCEPVSLLDLAHDQCRWPVGAKFCGKTKMPPYQTDRRNVVPSYCEGHQRLSIRRDVGQAA